MKANDSFDREATNSQNTDDYELQENEPAATDTLSPWK